MRLITKSERAKQYEIEYTPLNDSLFIASHFTDEIQRILIIPCGNSRYVQYFKHINNINFTLIDIEPEVIDTTNKVIEKENLKSFTAVCGDIKHLDGKCQFDLIIVPQDSIQLFISDGELFKVIKSLKQALAPLGKIIFDASTFNKGSDASFRSRYFNPESRKLKFEWTRHMNENILLSRYTLQEAKPGSIQFTFYYVLRKIDFSLVDRYKINIELKLLSLVAFEKLLQDCNLAIDKVYGGYDFRKFDSNVSNRLIVVTQKL